MHYRIDQSHDQGYRPQARGAALGSRARRLAVGHLVDEAGGVLHRPSANNDPTLGVSGPVDANLPVARFDEQAGAESWRRPAPRIGPALIVIGIAVFLILGGGAIALFDRGNPSSSSNAPVLSSSGALSSEPAAPLLKRIIIDGQPPGDVVQALVLPKGSVLVSSANETQGLSPYDRSVTVKVNAKSASVNSFFKIALKRNHWTSISTSLTSNGGTEVFGRHVSIDGYYWEVGVVVTPVSPSISPALSGDNVSSASTVKLTVFEVDDEE